MCSKKAGKCGNINFNYTRLNPYGQQNPIQSYLKICPYFGICL